MADKKTVKFTMRMDPEKKQEMEEFFDDLGLSLAYGISLFFEQCIMLAGLPFEVKRKDNTMPTVEELAKREAPALKTTLFSMRMDPYKKAQVEYTFEELGIKASDAVNMYFEACLHEWGIPFRVGYPKPNAETLAAMQEGEDILAGKVETVDYNTVEELMAAWESGAFERDRDMPTGYGSAEVYRTAKKLEAELIRREMQQEAGGKEENKV